MRGVRERPYFLERVGRRNKYVKSPLNRKYFVFALVILIAFIALIFYSFFNPFGFIERSVDRVDILPLSCDGLSLDPVVCVYDSISIEVGFGEDFEKLDEAIFFLYGSEIYEVSKLREDSAYLIDNFEGSVFVFPRSVSPDLERVEVGISISGESCGISGFASCREIVEDADDSDFESDFS